MITGAGGQLGHALAEAFPDARALTRADWDVAYPPPPGLERRPRPAHRGVDRRRRRGGRPAGVRPRSTSAGCSMRPSSTHRSSSGPATTSSTAAKREPYVESDAPAPLGVYGRTKLHGEAAAGERAWIVRSSWLFGWTSKNFVRTMLRLGAANDEVAVVDDQRGAPTYVGHLAAATEQVLRLPYGVYHVAAAETARGPISPRRSSKRPASPHACGGSRATSSVPGRLVRRTPFCAASEARPSFRTGARASASAWRGCEYPVAMRVLVTGGAGFIGSHFARRLADRGEDVVVLDKLTYAGNRTNLEGVEHEFHHGDIADPDAVARAAQDCDAIVNFAAETHVDRSILGPAEFILTDVLGHAGAARPRAARPVAARARLDRRGLRRHPARRAGLQRGRAAPHVEPVLRFEGRRRAPGVRLRPHVRCRRAGHARREHLRPAPVSREVPAALHHQRTRRPSTCRSTATASSDANGSTSRITATASSWRCGTALRARPTTSAGRSARTWRS